MRTVGRGPRATRRDHAWIDERSRALHARVAEKLRQRPELLAVAGANLDRWETLRGPDPTLDEWRSLLRETALPDLLRLLTQEGENADRLRQSSPFAGILTVEERTAVFAHYETL
jgi:hypothetical protein